MSCWHGGCGSWHGWPPPRGWYGPPVDEADLYEFEERQTGRRRRRRERPMESEAATASLEARLDELQDQLRRVEAALSELRRTSDESAEPG